MLLVIESLSLEFVNGPSLTVPSNSFPKTSAPSLGELSHLEKEEDKHKGRSQADHHLQCFPSPLAPSVPGVLLVLIVSLKFTGRQIRSTCCSASSCVELHTPETPLSYAGLSNRDQLEKGKDVATSAQTKAVKRVWGTWPGSQGKQERNCPPPFQHSAVT